MTLDFTVLPPVSYFFSSNSFCAVIRCQNDLYTELFKVFLNKLSSFLRHPKRATKRSGSGVTWSAKIFVCFRVLLFFPPPQVLFLQQKDSCCISSPLTVKKTWFFLSSIVNTQLYQQILRRRWRLFIFLRIINSVN